MMKSLIAIVGALGTSQAAKQAVATFTGEVTGTVTVDVQKVTLDLDISSVLDSLTTGDTPCIGTKGLGWHIHNKWNYSASTSLYGADPCGPDYTQGHYDEWNACGKASGNPYCDTEEDADMQCLYTGGYVPAWDTDPYSVEVGDWSNKYGAVLPVDGKLTGSWSSFYEVIPSDVLDFSVVFHCESGSRIFCGKFEASTEAQASTTVSQSSTVDVEATFEGILSKDSTIKLYSDGGVNLKLDATEIADADKPSCTTGLEYSIWTAKANADLVGLMEGGFGADCEAVLGEQWDPTRQCLPWVNNDWCTRGGTLCGDDTYAYECTGVADRYACAPGDLSGKFGTLDIATALTEDNTADMLKWTLTPPTDILAGTLVVITCPYKDGDTKPEVFACSVFEEMGSSTSDSHDHSHDSSDESAAGMLVMNWLAMFCVALWAAYE